MISKGLDDESQNNNSSVPEQAEPPIMHHPTDTGDELWRHNMSFMNPGPTPAQSNIPDNSRPEDSIPWKKVALVALLTPVLALVLYQLTVAVVLGLGFAVALVLLVLMPVIRVLPAIIALAISGKFLERNALKYSYFHVFFAGFFALMSYLVAYKYLSPILAANSKDLLTTLALIGDGAVYFGFTIGLFGSIWLIHKTFGGTNTALIKILILTMVVGAVTIVAYKAPEPSFPNAKTSLETLEEEEATADALRNDALKSWLYVPKYNIPGTVGNEGCYQMEKLYETPECTIRFSEFPAYLSDETFSILTESLDDTSAELKDYPLLKVKIGKDNKILEQFKIKDGKCSLFELGIALRADYEGAVRTPYKPEGPKICNSLVTPKGTQLVYESHLNYDKEYAEIPAKLYFEKDNNVVVIYLAAGRLPYIKKSTIAEVIAGAPETQEELFSFVDGFEPINN